MKLFAFFRRLGMRLGLIKPPPRRHRYDAHLDQVLVQIMEPGAFIIAVETHSAMTRILTFAWANGITSIGAAFTHVPNYQVGHPQHVFRQMRYHPSKCRVVVMLKVNAATGWTVPPPYIAWWGSVKLLATFDQREPWKTQYQSRIRRAQGVEHA